MGVPQDKSVRRFVRWLKDKIENRRGRDGDQDPWWVTLLLDVGRPAVAVLILTMCAPGEHYLAKLVGFGKLSWGMPGALTAYAGIAAVVATKRPTGAPGRKTAVAGALLSILVAMAAQPLAHLYQQQVWTLTPVGRVWMTIAVSCVPAAVFGHLLHMGAVSPRPVRPAVSGGRDKSRTAKPDKPSVRVEAVLSGSDSGVRPASRWLADNRTAADAVGLSVSELMPAASVPPDSSPDAARWTPPEPVRRPVPLKDKQNLSARAAVLASTGQDKDTIKDTLRTEFPGAKADSIRKAADRAADKLSAVN